MLAQDVHLSAQPQACPEIVFTHRVKGLTYDAIPQARCLMLDFLERQGTPKARAGMLLLSLSEVLTNLLRHPEQKPDIVHVILRITPQMTLLDIADDSSTFELFDAKCDAALSRMIATESFAESGYGLGCILRQHTHIFYTPKNMSNDGLNHFNIQDEAEKTMPSPSQKTTPPQEKKKTLYLIDDDPIALNIHQTMLEETYRVIAFEDARSAITAFKKFTPDIIVSDMTMPDMDGIDLRCALSDLPGGTTAPFIFLSGHNEKEASAYVNQLGVDDFLCKPVSKEKLLNVVERLITRSQQVKLSLEGKFNEDLTNILKPSLPEAFSGWKITTFNQVAEAGGGDFTLHHETKNSMLAVLADVMGHGHLAKFFAYAYAGYLRSIFRMCTDSEDPAGFLQRLSKTIEDDSFLQSVILTCQSFQFFPKGNIAIASAGHPSPILIRPKSCHMINVAGPLPALSMGTTYLSKTITLSPGDKILFATDGFFTAFDPEGHKYKELILFLNSSARKTSRHIGQSAWDEYNLRTHASQENKDDATLIIAEYGGEQ